MIIFSPAQSLWHREPTWTRFRTSLATQYPTRQSLQFGFRRFLHVPTTLDGATGETLQGLLRRCSTGFLGTEAEAVSCSIYIPRDLLGTITLT